MKNHQIFGDGLALKDIHKTKDSIMKTLQEIADDALEVIGETRTGDTDATAGRTRTSIGVWEDFLDNYEYTGNVISDFVAERGSVEDLGL